MRLSFLAALIAFATAGSLNAADATGTASVTVRVPVGATLHINAQPTRQMTAVRIFVTPPLPVGKRFKYNLEATYTWLGDEVTKRRSVEVTAGATVHVDMTEGETVVKPPPPPEPEPKPEKKPEPEPKKPERKPEPPAPEPKVEKTKPKKQPEPRPDPDRPKPPAANVEPQRPQAPPPREVKPKKGK